MLERMCIRFICGTVHLVVRVFDGKIEGNGEDIERVYVLVK